jgi:hypothetical protein
LALSAGIASAATDRRVDDIVRVEDVQSDDATVRGRLVNETNDALENVRLIVADQFLWRNERHPGDDSRAPPTASRSPARSRRTARWPSSSVAPHDSRTAPTASSPPTSPPSK